MGASVKRFDGRDLGSRKPVMNLLQLLAGEHVVLLVLGPPSRHYAKVSYSSFLRLKGRPKKRRGKPRLE